MSLALSVCFGTGAATAQGVGPTASPKGATEYFLDLKDGARVPPTFHVHFGLRDMGVSPAGVDFPRTGHHHLLVDVPLPPLDQPIPADDNHIHYGDGQTEADVTLPLGPHTLQLLMGDRDHVPHNPPVYSALIHVTVVPARKPSPPGAEAYLISPRNGEVVPSDEVVRFGLHGMGVAPAGDPRPNTGQHNLVIDAPTPPVDQPLPTDDRHINYGDGQTEADLHLEPGRHTLQLVLSDGKKMNFDPPVVSKVITVVVRQNRAVRRR